jgi:hypothetical protein
MKAFFSHQSMENIQGINIMMRPYSDVAAEIAQRNANNYVPPSIPKQ